MSSQILGSYYKLKKSKRTAAVYWLRGTLLYPCIDVTRLVQTENLLVWKDIEMDGHDWTQKDRRMILIVWNATPMVRKPPNMRNG